MRRPAQRELALLGAVVVSLLTTTSCSESTPTQPTGSADASVPTTSLATASNTWTDKASVLGDQYFYGWSVGMAPNSNGESIVYAIGGASGDDGNTSYRIQAYNPVTNTWTYKNSSAHVFHLNGVGKIGSRLYFSGGFDFGSGSLAAHRDVWAYDYTNDRMIRKAVIPVISGDGVTGVIDGKLYVLPGTCSGDGYPSPGYCAEEPIRKLYRYDPGTNTWEGRASAPHFHKYGAAGVINGKFYVAAGVHDFDPVADLDVYDPATNTWKTLAPFPGGGGGATGAVIQGKLFVIAAGHAYAYDPATNQWKAKAAPTSGGPIIRIFIAGKPYLFLAGRPSQLYTP
jgi:N-acetylneuraminic acid mutarotase